MVLNEVPSVDFISSYLTEDINLEIKIFHRAYERTVSFIERSANIENIEK